MTFPYTLIRSKRRSLSIQIKHDGILIVRAPLRMSIVLIEDFIVRKRSWIEKHQKRMNSEEGKVLRKIYTDEEGRVIQTRLKAYITERVGVLWKGKNLPPYTSIKITKSEQRWGSCSGKNGLCFSYRLAEYLDEDALALSSRAKSSDLHDHEFHQLTETDASQAQNNKKNFIDAIIIHELAHLREKNHQTPFWNLVYNMMPEYEAVMRGYRNLANI